jgi:hypothetical protein
MKKLLLTTALVAISLNAISRSVIWCDGHHPVTYNVQKGSKLVVKTASDMFSSDMKNVTGMRAMVSSPANAKILITQLDIASDATKLQLKSANVPVDEIATKSECFDIRINKNGKILVTGSDGRGTAYGILELSRIAGVSPWTWWADSKPLRCNVLTINDDFHTTQSPSVKYRGIFLNDEDWSLQPWSWQTYEKGNPTGYIGAKTYKQIFKLLLRLRANTIWPAMHGGTTPFYFVKGAKETADSCGIIVGTSHCEPLMRNNVGEWNVNERGQFNYVTNGKNVRDYWTERLKDVARYDNIYTIGMRGIHDGSMEGVKTMQDKTTWLQKAIDDQRMLLKKYVNKDVTQIPQVFVPYKEVLQIMENGLNVPEDVTLLWCDDNYGYITRLREKNAQQRSGGAGVYYHLSYWGRPHDYLWLCSTQPGLVYSEMKQAYDNNARKEWIVNIHDPKPAAYNLELFMDMAWNINSVTPSTINNHLGNWLNREFGVEAGEKLLPVMLEYYRLCGIRKPEHMGWTQVELDKKSNVRGLSWIKDTEFSNEFGGEMDRYLEHYAEIKKAVGDIKQHIAPDKRDAYFSHIEYQVDAAADMATKMLEAQRARSLATGQVNATLWSRQSAMDIASAKSYEAYHDIQHITDYYNNKMADGKWKYSMNNMPRDLFAFYPPMIPVMPSDSIAEEIIKKAAIEKKHTQKVNDAIAMDACQYTKASEGAYTIQALGHSMNSVALPKGDILEYQFDTERDSDALLRVAVIPTQPNDDGDIRIAVSIDGKDYIVKSYKEKDRSEQWKLNVLRGQAVLLFPVNITKGHHTLCIKALDNHVEVDQWMIDFKTDRHFYVFPTQADKI